MKRISSSRLTKFGSVELHREDLDHIIHLLETSGSPVVISNDEFQFESLGELQDRLGSVPPTLRIGVNQPTVQLTFRDTQRSNCELRSVDGANDGSPDSLFLKISDFISKKQRSKFTRWPGYLLCAIAVIITAAWVRQPVLFPFGIHIPGVNVLLPFLGTSIAVAAYVWAEQYPNKIFLTKKAENPTYLQRAGDDLIGRVVTGFITAVVSLLVGYALGKSHH